MKRYKRRNIALSIAGILLCLVLISMHLTAGMFASFKTRAIGGDSAKVASFSTSAELTPDDAETGAYHVKLCNNSETAVSCVMILTFDNTVTAEQVSSVKLMKGTEVIEYPFKTEIEIDSVCLLAPGSVNEDYTIVIVPTSEDGQDSNEEPDFDNAVTRGENYDIPFTIRVDFTQVH